MAANNNNQPNGTKSSDLSFDEAPASWNTRYLDPNGFECQITLRGETGSELLEKATSAVAYLMKNGCIPYSYRSGAGRKEGSSRQTQGGTNGNLKTNPDGKENSNGNSSWCPIHQCEMKKWDKEGCVWYSHKVDGKWCNGK
jgi:hypothetical protein